MTSSIVGGLTCVVMPEDEDVDEVDVDAPLEPDAPEELDDV